MSELSLSRFDTGGHLRLSKQEQRPATVLVVLRMIVDAIGYRKNNPSRKAQSTPTCNKTFDLMTSPSSVQAVYDDRLFHPLFLEMSEQMFPGSTCACLLSQQTRCLL